MTTREQITRDYNVNVIIWTLPLQINDKWPTNRKVLSNLKYFNQLVIIRDLNLFLWIKLVDLTIESNNLNQKTKDQLYENKHTQRQDSRFQF